MSESTTTFGAADAGTIKAVPLECVTVSYNVRGVLPRLDAAGFPYARLLKMSIGTTEERAEFVRLVEEHEAETARLNPKAHTVIELAYSIMDRGQLQPIVVRQLGTSQRRDETGDKMEGMKYGYAIIMGGRRTLATAYLHACGLADPVVLARQVKVTKEEARDMSVAENLQRQPFSDAEMGEIVASYRDEGRTWGEIVRVLRRSEQCLRDCYILIRPEAIDAPTDLAQQVEAGIITKGQAVQIAKGQSSLGDGGERLFKAVRKALAVKDIEALIDATPREGEAHLARLTAFAEVLNEAVEASVLASDGRIQARVDKARKTAAKAEATRLEAAATELTRQARAARMTG